MTADLERATQDIHVHKQKLQDVCTKFIKNVPEYAVKTATDVINAILFLGFNYETEEFFTRLCDALALNQALFEKEAVKLEQDLTLLLTHYIDARDAYLAKR